jgi:N-acetyltransferase
VSGRLPESAPERSSSKKGDKTGETRAFTLEGQLARLEPIRLDHVEGLLDAAHEDRSTFAFTWVPSDRAAMTAYVERGIALREAGEQVPFVTWSRREERIVGSTRFYDLTPWDWSFLSSNLATDQRHDRPDVASIGYTWLARSAQRGGINTEAKVLMMTHAFEQWGVRAVRLLTDARNERSRAAIARLGCTLDGVLRADRPAADGTVRDSAVFSMLANEWPAHKASLIARLAGGTDA